MMYNFMNPDTTVRTAGLLTAGASTILNRTNTLFNMTSSMFHPYGWGTDLDPFGVESYINNQNEHLNENKTLYE